MKLSGDMMETDKKLETAINTEYGVFGVRMRTNHIIVTLSDGSDFGQLNKHTSEALLELLATPELEFEATANIRDIRHTIGKAQKASDAVVRVNINVCGPRALGPKVGADLSKNKVWLQHPENPRHPYDNPHVIVFPGIDETTIVQASREVVETSHHSHETSKPDSAEQFHKTVAQVYGSLKRGKEEDLARMEGDERLKTQLLPYVLTLPPSTAPALLLTDCETQTPRTGLGFYDTTGDWNCASAVSTMETRGKRRLNMVRCPHRCADLPEPRGQC